MGNITINQDSLRTAREWKRHKIQDGSNVYRILPPYGDVEVHNNYPYRRWSIAWLVDPKSGNRRPFATPLTDGDEKCPVKEYQEALKAFIDTKKAQLEAGGASKEELKNALKGLYEIQWQIRVQHLYAYNACDKSGNVGLLELKSTAHKAMKKKMAEYIEKYGQDPTSLNSDLREDSGVWFNIKREGTGKETTYTVEFNQNSSKDDDGELVFKNDRSALPPNVVDGFYRDLAYDLNAVYRRKSYDELKEILVHNLALVADEVPEAVLPGFGATDVVTEVQSKVEDKPAAKPAAAKKPVNLNLGGDDDDDGDDEPPFQTASKTAKAKPAPATMAADSDMDDLKNFADSILGD